MKIEVDGKTYELARRLSFAEYAEFCEIELMRETNPGLANVNAIIFMNKVLPKVIHGIRLDTLDTAEVLAIFERVAQESLTVPKKLSPQSMTPT